MASSVSSWEASHGLPHGKLAWKLTWGGSLRLLVPPLFSGMVGFSVVLSSLWPGFSVFLVEASLKWEVVQRSLCILAVE